MIFDCERVEMVFRGIRKGFDIGLEWFGVGKGGVGFEFGCVMGELGCWDVGGLGRIGWVSWDKELVVLCGSFW